MERPNGAAVFLPVQGLPGIAAARAKLLHRIGIDNLGQLVQHFPRGYENRGNTTTLAQALPGTVVSVILTVSTQPKTAMLRRELQLLKFSAFDESGVCQITYFNQQYLRDVFVIGGTYRFYGKIEQAKLSLQMTNPKYDPLPPGTDADTAILKPFVPVYPTVEGISQRLLSGAIQRALHEIYHAAYADTLPYEIRMKYGLAAEAFAMEQIHFPSGEDDLDRARRRLIFEELFLFSLGLARKKAATEAVAAQRCGRIDMTPFFQALPYRLTGAQKKAIDEMLSDMAEGNAPMNRILMGDVGSGKTVCAAAAAYFAIQNGYQVAMMAPTEILARQHMSSMDALFSAMGIPVALLVGATKPKEKEEIKERLLHGNIPFVIGTHALLEESVMFDRLGLVITDEQHRFGVRQRAKLQQKTEGTHVLVMSATPIPRTLALMLYGDLSMSTLDELPAGRQAVQTICADESLRQRLYAFVRKLCRLGQQVYVVCPAISREDENERTMTEDGEQLLFSSENPTSPRKCAIEVCESLTAVFPDLTVGCLHGKMKSTEKDQVMQAFVNGHIQVLVATTVIEVGVDVPNATLMIVENAELFGLSQLHQLRGRVGRGKEKSYCVLMSDTTDGTARQRLDTMKHTASGFAIAQKDLELRGPGDFFARGGVVDHEYRQSGGVRFRIASLCEDMKTISDAFEAAASVIAADPALSLPEHNRMREKIEEQFGQAITL